MWAVLRSYFGQPLALALALPSFLAPDPIVYYTTAARSLQQSARLELIGCLGTCFIGALAMQVLRPA